MTETETETTTTPQTTEEKMKSVEDLELRHAWTLWLKFPGGKEEEGATEVGTARTARQFWSLYEPVGLLARANHTASVARGLGVSVTAPTKCDVFLMRAGVRPAWEDPAHADGGYYSFRVARHGDGAEAALAATLASVVSGQDAFEGVTGVNARVRPALVGVDVWYRRGAQHGLRRALEGVIARAHIVCDVAPDCNTPLRCLTWRKATQRSASGSGSASPARSSPTAAAAATVHAEETHDEEEEEDDSATQMASETASE